MSTNSERIRHQLFFGKVASLIGMDKTVELLKEAESAIPKAHNIEFEIGQTVYLKMDNEQHGRMVTGISLRPNGSVTYCLAFGTTETWHYGIEISDERDIVKATTG